MDKPLEKILVCCVTPHTDDRPEGYKQPSLEEIVDKDLARFEEYFCGLGNSSLVKSERAAIKTYLWWKYNEDGAGKPKPSLFPSQPKDD